MEEVKKIYRLLVFVCSPFSGGVFQNIEQAKTYSRFAVDKTAIPLTPHLLNPQFMDDNNIDERELAMHFNYAWLGKSQEVWEFGGVVSKGRTREIGIAEKRRMKIRWFTWDLKEAGEYA